MTLKDYDTVLGINERNLRYVGEYNAPRFIRTANNKIATKKLLGEAGISVPETYLIIRRRETLASLDAAALQNSFVIKPNKGFGGMGVLIVYAKKKGADGVWVKSNRNKITMVDIKNHIMDILDGTYSLAQKQDSAFFEERIKLLPIFKPLAYRGIPDIRVIVFNRVPVMAELRLPTKESNGKANLHLGGIGVGIDMANGITTNAIQHDQLIDYIPETRTLLAGFRIPSWKKILETAIAAQTMSSLGYAGVDIALDRDKGPMVLEVNARPGLAIQIANLSGLRDRLERIKGLKVKTIDQGVRLAQDLFGGEIEQELEEISGKKIVGVITTIMITQNALNKELRAKLDTGAYFSSIDRELADSLGLNQFKRTVKVKSSLGEEERDLVDVNFILDGRPINTQFSLAERGNLRFPVIIGRRDLRGFLVDPKKLH